MLTAIREKATGWLAWVIVILITIPFALWGINSYFEGGSELSVATVNGEDISVYTYQEDLALQTRLLSERLGANFDPELLNTLGIRQRVLDNLINNRLLYQYVGEHNFRISDNQLTQLIQNHESFQVDGKFNLAQYEAILNANQFTPQSFEQYQRVNEAVSQLRIGISGSAFVTEFEKNRLLALQGQSRTGRYAVIEADSYLESIQVDDNEIQAYYDRNLERYQNVARIKVNYIELSTDALMEHVTPAEEEIVDWYEDTKGRYRTAENRRASHILISVSATASDQEKQEKLDQANDILQRANSGEDFASLAEQYSDDPGSSQNGGDLGIVARNQMVKPFEDAVYSMLEGDIQGPVETRFGYHVIKLTELKEGEQQTLDEVREEVSREVQQAQAENLFADLAESFKNLVFEDPENLTTAADELDLPIQVSDWFTQTSGGGVATDAQVRRAAFSEDVLTDNLVSPAVEIGFDKLVAVQKLEYEPVSPKSLDSVKGEVIAAIKQEKSQQEVLELGSGYLTELEKMNLTGAAWDEFVSDKGLESLALPLRKLDAPPALTNLADAVFAFPRPAEGQVGSGGIALGDGSYVLFIVEEVTNALPGDVDEALKTSLTQQLVSRDGNELYNQFSQMLRDKAEIMVYEDQL